MQKALVSCGLDFGDPISVFNLRLVTLTYDYRERVEEIEKLWQTLLAQTEKKGESKGLAASSSVCVLWLIRGADVAEGLLILTFILLEFCTVGAWTNSRVSTCGLPDLQYLP